MQTCVYIYTMYMHTWAQSGEAPELKQELLSGIYIYVFWFIMRHISRWDYSTDILSGLFAYIYWWWCCEAISLQEARSLIFDIFPRGYNRTVRIWIPHWKVANYIFRLLWYIKNMLLFLRYSVSRQSYTGRWTNTKKKHIKGCRRIIRRRTGRVRAVCNTTTIYAGVDEKV